MNILHLDLDRTSQIDISSSFVELSPLTALIQEKVSVLVRKLELTNRHEIEMNAADNETPTSSICTFRNNL